MAICEMSSMSILGLKKERNDLLDVLSATGAAQIKKCENYEFVTPVAASDNVLSDVEARKSLAFLEFCYEELGDKKLPPVAKDGFGVEMKDFLSFGDRTAEVETAINKILSLSEEYASVKGEIAKIGETVGGYEEYSCLKEKFSYYAPTKSTITYLGTVSSDKSSAVKDALDGIDLVVSEIIGVSGAKSGLAAISLKKDAEEVSSLLSKFAFSKCPYTDDMSAKEKIAELDSAAEEKQKKLKEILLSAAEMNSCSADIKTYIDYIGFLNEKTRAEEDSGETQETFLTEVYVPTEAIGAVESALKARSAAVYTEHKPIPRDEFAPTLMKNNKTVSDFEVVTNMYSAPAYGALDPNGVMAFFFSLFMGVIMGDAGYGLLMIIGGFLLAAKSRKGTSVYRMARVFAYGGFFAVAFGFLFDSFLGFALLRNIPAYAEFYAAYVDPIAAKCTLAGITVPSALMWCLGLGTFQIAVSLIMKAVQCFKRGQVVEGIFSGLVYLLYPTLALFGVGILTSGITEKGFGKVTKIFGSAYGLINYASDILSYARLYGLMLAGAQIASIFTNSIAVGMLFPKGVFGVIAGIVVIIAGNLFNLAMNLLGAFIHDSRLQYVEFFGRFYEGEGELFAPIGSQREFIYFK